MRTGNEPNRSGQHVGQPAVRRLVSKADVKRAGIGQVQADLSVIHAEQRSFPDWCGKEKWRILPED
jgi:hypothetical protein